MSDKKTTIIDVDDLLTIWKFIAKNWYLFIILPAFAALLAYLYTHRLPEIYAAKSEILVKSEKNYDAQNEIYQGLTGFYQTYADIINQKRVLQSHDLIETTIKKLGFELSYYIVGRVKTSEIDRIEPLSIDIKLINQGLYQQPFDIWIKDKDQFKLSYETNGKRKIENYNFSKEIVTNDFILTVKRNKNLTDKTIESLKENNYKFVVNSLDFLVNKYKGALTLQNDEYSSIITIMLQDELPEKAKTFLDTLSNVYIDYTVQSQKKQNESTLLYIDKQLSGITQILDSIESSLEVYKERKDILDLTKEQNNYFENLVKYEAEKRANDLKIQSLGSLENYILNSSVSKPIPPAFYMLENDEVLNNSLNELYNMQVKRNESLYSLKEENLNIVQGDKSMEALRKNIMIYVKDSKKAIQEKNVNLMGQINDYEGMLRQLPRSQRDILNIERKQSVNETLYMFLLEKRANTVIARAGIIPQTSIIEVARSIGIVGPDKQKITYLFIFSGLFLALIIAFTRQLFYLRIETTRELKQITKTAILGGVPKSENVVEGRVGVMEDSKSNLSESFRSIRTNLQYVKDDKSSHVIMLTSLHPGEGKTFCSVNLAAIIAKAGKKVLLVDIDMHKPKVHKTLGVENTMGVSTFLAGLSKMEEIIKPSIIESMFVITAGAVPPNASELVLSDRLFQLIEACKLQFEYIIVDTPPLLLISDAMVIKKFADTSIFVMNTEKATKQGVKFVEEIIESNNMQSSSIILNNIKQKKWKYYYSKYTYGYGYGYSYGYGYGSKYKK
jgi:capsular exopolysaccharide synthesis family protein